MQDYYLEFCVDLSITLLALLVAGKILAYIEIDF